MAKGKLVDLGPVGIYQNGILYDYAERKTFARFIIEARQRWESTPGKKAPVKRVHQSRYFRVSRRYWSGVWYSLTKLSWICWQMGTSTACPICTIVCRRIRLPMDG